MWDGGINNLELQPLGPITNKAEMDNTLENVVRHLDTSHTYRTQFYNAFGDSTITGQRVLKALAQFTVMFQSYNSRYDKYMRKEAGGDMSPQELRGLSIIREKCSTCHPEPLFTNYTYQNTGLPIEPDLKDYGRMTITGDPADSLKFKVPSLRNVAMTYPYMHDGRFRSIRQVLDHYTNSIVQSPTLAKEFKQGMALRDQDKKDIIAFLETLTDREFLQNTLLKEQ
jgi:cytochrome c peroxidase